MLPFTLLFWIRVYKPFLCFLSREDPSFVEELNWWCWLLLRFCLSEKLLISPSYLNEMLAGYSNLGCRFFSFITLSMSCHSLLTWRISVERSAVILMGIPLCAICCFSLAAFKIFLCVWSLLIWLICVLGCFTLGLSCLGLYGPSHRSNHQEDSDKDVKFKLATSPHHSLLFHHIMRPTCQVSL